ncbi:hypothetical protein [Streptococcus sp. CSL10205-OR2]
MSLYFLIHNIEQQSQDLMSMLGQLKGTTPEAQTELENFLKDFKL